MATARPRGVYGTTKKNVPGVLTRARIMYTAILAALANFPSLPISMAAFLLIIQAAEAAQIAAKAGTKGLASLRNTKRDLVWTAMESLRIYVQGLCDEVSAEAAATLIESAGLLVAKTSGYAKPLLAAKLVPATGVVRLIAYAAMLLGKPTTKKVTFNWSVCSDGKTWNNLPSTPYADTEVAGLGPGTYLFRVSVTIGKVPGEWSQSTSLILH